MAKKGAKHDTVKTVTLALTGGLNYAQTPITLEDTEIRLGTNFIYDPDTEYPVTRPGTDCQTAAVCDGANPLLVIYYYEKTVSVSYLVAACNGNLYYLSGASLDGWTFIGALNDAVTVPSFLTFNSKLLIADGGSEIKTWDGLTYGTLAGSPAASALATINNRVVANAVDELDSVYMSKTSDETNWDTAGSAVGLKAGFGDTLSVIAFGVFGNDLFVFKKGQSARRIYRVNLEDSDPTSWYVRIVSENNCALNNNSVVEAWDNVFFVDSTGFKSIEGTDVYGDLATDPIGRRVNTLFPWSVSCDFMSYIPLYDSIWFGVGQRVFSYTKRGSGDDKKKAFTDLLFRQGRIRDVCQAGSVVYLAGEDGFLYIMNEGVATDAINATETENFPSTLRTKTLSPGGDLVLRKLQWYLRPKLAGVASFNVYIDDNTGIQVGTVTLRDSGAALYDATGDLYDATGYLYDEGSPTWVETIRNRIRSTQLAFEIVVSSGRVGIDWVRAEMAVLEGGE
jgi:hypothetical protein